MYSFYNCNIHKAEALNNINMNKILKKLKELYEDNLVYRTIIISNNIEICKEILNTNNYDVYVIDKYKNINYDSLDTRIFLIDKNNFTQFINDLNDNNINSYNSNFYNAVIYDSNDSNDSYYKELRNICNKDIIIF